uniref:Uncharacterized protein n=1 Tax=Arundo donax TaxID=35708 RepID=A0A0A8YAA8_ARUDO
MDEHNDVASFGCIREHKSLILEFFPQLT